MRQELGVPECAAEAQERARHEDENLKHLAPVETPAKAITTTPCRAATSASILSRPPMAAIFSEVATISARLFEQTDRRSFFFGQCGVPDP